MPLGDVWSGVCRADAAPFVPDNPTVSELCNMGYARGSCSRYPQAGKVDAVRFVIAEDRDQLIRIAYAIERDHHPHSHGALEYRRPQDVLDGAAADPLLERQALAYVESYLRHKPAV
jgi:hypothetical protein